MPPLAAPASAAQPWLSILVPVYNVQPWLHACLDSVRSQLLPGVEVIAVEDASTDGSLAALQDIKTNLLPTLEIRCHASNRGLSAARNTALDAARGTYLWFLDSDDMLAPGAIAALKAVVDRHAPDLVLCDFRIQREHPRLKHLLRGEHHRRTFDGPHDVLSSDQASLLRGVFARGQMHSWSKITHRRLWSGGLQFPVATYFEDAHTTPRLLLKAKNYYHASSPWIIYRQREGSILRTLDGKKLHDMVRAFDDFLEAYARTPLARDRGVALGISSHLSRVLTAACKKLRHADGEVQRSGMADCAALLERMPTTPRALLAGLMLKGWVWRAARFAYWRHHVQRRIHVPA